jgi:hypothetical protein
MKKQVIQEVDIAQLKSHPGCAGIYRTIFNEEFIEEIRNNGILHPPIVDKQYRIIGGERTIEAAKKAGYKTIKVCVVDVTESEAPVYRVFSNTIRDKTDSEIFMELKILREFYGKKQGKRPILHEVQADLDKCDLRTKMVKITGLSATKIQRIEKLGQKGLLDYADLGEIPITALYNSVEAKNNDASSYKAEEKISLESKCCNACHQETGKIVFTRASELHYNNNIDKDDILF